MKIYFSDQKNKFEKHLEFFKAQPIMIYDKINLAKKTSQIQLNIKAPIEDLNLQFLFNYQIFPPNMLTGLTEWNLENREMKIGDTIVQQIYLPPTNFFSKKLVFGVRITNIINEQNKIGFAYETLAGHVEKGISTFMVEKNGSKLLFKIQTHSSPGNILSQILSPIFSIPYQSYCTRKALENVKKQAELHNQL